MQDDARITQAKIVDKETDFRSLVLFLDLTYRVPMRNRACSVCFHDGKILVVHLKDPATQATYAFPPGGRVEPGELPHATAERETREESGYQVKVDPDKFFTLRYFFSWEGTKHDCRTSFYPAELVDRRASPIVGEPYLVKVEWVEIREMPRLFDFLPDMRDLLVSLSYS